MFKLAGKKIGMSRLFDAEGAVVSVTLVEIFDACVSDIIDTETQKKVALLSFDEAKKVKNFSKPQKVAFEKKGLSLYNNTISFQLEEGDEYKVGDKLGCDKVQVSDFFDVQGVSKGKGFAGGMKRHNFRGLEATHGVSVSHRSHGSTGQCQDPGRVFKGKKMAGRMGNENVTVKNLEVVEIMPESNVICIKGAIPGGKNGIVILKKSNL